MFAAHLTSSEVHSDFQIWFSPGFPMQSRQARSDPLHGISIPNSSSALILLRLFFHLHLLVFFPTSLWVADGTEMADVEQTQKMIPFITCEISLCQYVCDLVLVVNVFWFGSWGPNWFYQTTNQEQLCGSGNMSHCRASFLFDHLDHCFVVFKDVQQSFLTRRIHVRGSKINIFF